MLLSEERKLISDFDGPVPSPIHYRETYSSVFILFFITSDYSVVVVVVVVVVFVFGGDGVFFPMPVILNNPLCLLRRHLCLTNYC